MKKGILLLLKVAIPAAIIYYLLRQLTDEQVEMLRNQPKNWGLIGLAFALSFVSLTLAFARWWLLVRTLGLPFRFVDALRLGFLGFLMNFISPGAVGGDLFKAVFIAREHPGRRGEAVASVLVDRVVGLYALLLVALVGIFSNGLLQAEDVSVRMLCRTTVLGAAVGGAGLVVLLLPQLTQGWLSKKVSGIRWVGGALARVIAGVRMYKDNPGIVVLIAIVSIAAHVLLAVVIALLARAMFTTVPSMLEHFVMVPLALIANAIPAAPGGLGAMEFAFDKLYHIIPAQPHVCSGVLITLVYRLITIAIAAVGVVFYIRGRAEIQKVMDEAERIQTDEQNRPSAHDLSVATETPSSANSSSPG